LTETLGRAFPFTPAWEVEVTCEDLPGVVVPVGRIATPAAASIEVAASVASIIASVVTRVVAVESAATSPCCEYGPITGALQFIAGRFRGTWGW
jgi:hypothetical protein